MNEDSYDTRETRMTSFTLQPDPGREFSEKRGRELLTSAERPERLVPSPPPPPQPPAEQANTSQSKS